MSYNPLTAPLHQTPAGHVPADQSEQAQRDAMRLVILAEREQTAKAALEAEITKRLNALRGIIDAAPGEVSEPVSEPAPVADAAVTTAPEAVTPEATPVV